MREIELISYQSLFKGGDLSVATLEKISNMKKYWQPALNFVNVPDTSQTTFIEESTTLLHTTSQKAPHPCD